MPLPNNSLRYVLVYVFETDRGPYLIDAGWNTDDAFGALSGGMKEVGCDIADVQGVMVTHIHPDHYGLAGRIREASGAWISLHPADAELIHDRYDEPDDLLGPGGGRAAAHGRAARGARAAAERRHAGAAAGRRGGARHPLRGRGAARGARLGPHRHLDAGPFAGAPVLLRGDPGAHALGRPRAAPHHAQHPVPPPGRCEPAGRLPGLAGQARALRGQRGAAGPRVPLRRPARPARGVAPAPS